MIDTLHRLIPASAVLISNIRTITADNIFASLNSQGIPFQVKRLISGDWEIDASDFTDTEILAKLHMEEAGHHGTLLICTEACSRYELAPFRCLANELSRFVENYEIEMFFDGDVVMVCDSRKTLTVFHHAGGYAHVSLR